MMLSKPRREGGFTPALSILCAALLTGCASTALKTSWRDPAYSFGSIKSILILGVTNQESKRRYFEDQFVQTFKTYGIQGTPSYVLNPGGGVPNEAALKTYVKERGIQAVMVTRLLSKKTVDRVVPPSTTTSVTSQPIYNTGGYYNYYQTSQQVVTTTTPGYTVQEQIVDAETHLYDSSTGTLIWTGSSETILGGNVESLIREYVSLIAQQIFKANSNFLAGK